MSLVSYVPSNFTWTILALSIFCLLICGGAFYCVLRELKEHKKKKQTGQSKKDNNDNPLYNMNMSAEEIRRFKEFFKETKESEINKKAEELSKNRENQKTSEEDLSEKEKALKILYSGAEKNDKSENKEKIKDSLDFCSLSRNLKQLEDLRKSGLINDQEYQQLKLTLIK